MDTNTAGPSFSKVAETTNQGPTNIPNTVQCSSNSNRYQQAPVKRIDYTISTGEELGK